MSLVNRYFAIALIASFMSSVLSTPSLGGGASGSPGVIAWAKASVKKSVKMAKSEISRRHKRGLEYVKSNSKVKSLVAGFAAKVVLEMSAPGNAGKIIAAVFREFNRIQSSKKGLNKAFIHKAFEDALGTVVTTVCPACGLPLNLGKIAAAATTAYAYGFTIGK